MYNSPRNHVKPKNLNQNWGSSFLRTRISREAYLLQKRRWGDLKYWEWGFIVLSAIGFLVNIGFNIFQLVLALTKGEKYLFPILLTVYNAFAIYFLFVGVMKELPFQILMQLVTRLIIWIFNLVYFLTPKDTPMEEENAETENDIKAIRFYVSSSLLFLAIPVGAYVMHQYWTSNISLFKEVGTEPRYVSMCRLLFFGNGMIVLDTQITFVALLLVASTGLSTTDLFSLILLPVGSLLLFVWAFIGYFAMKRESRGLTYTFYILSHLHPIYVIYLIVRSSKASVGNLLFFSAITTALLFFVVHVGLLILVVKIHMNFDKGLKQAAAKEMARAKSLAQSLNECAMDNVRVRSPMQTDI